MSRCYIPSHQLWSRHLPGHGLLALVGRCRLCLWAFVGVILGCAQTPVAPHTELQFAQPDSASPVGLRELASNAARYYVQVSIVDQSTPDQQRQPDNRSRVINGASGTLVDTAGHIVTAAHIAQHPGLDARITTIDGKSHAARVVRVAPELELALLQIDHDQHWRQPPAPTFGTDVGIGQPVFAIGTPLGEAGVVTPGVVSSRLIRRFSYDQFSFENPLMLKMTVQPGHSGGPVFDHQGHLVGIIVGFDMRVAAGGEYVTVGNAYAVPADQIEQFLQH